MKKTISILVFIFMVVGGYYVYASYTHVIDPPTACTLEALICPDGTAVGRTGPDCEFAVCPAKAEKTLSVGDTTLFIEIADTKEKREKGLSGRSLLAENTGMLFVFETSGLHSFWMKDTLIPLDMIWINADKEIVHIERNVTPDTYPKTFTSDIPALYVLEVEGGFSTEYGFTEGDGVQFEL